MTLFPKRSHSEVPEVKTSTYLFGGRNSTYNRIYVESALRPWELNEKYECPNPENIIINPATAREEEGGRNEAESSSGDYRERINEERKGERWAGEDFPSVSGQEVTRSSGHRRSTEPQASCDKWRTSGPTPGFLPPQLPPPLPSLLWLLQLDSPNGELNETFSKWILGSLSTPSNYKAQQFFSSNLLLIF